MVRSLIYPRLLKSHRLHAFPPPPFSSSSNRSRFKPRTGRRIETKVAGERTLELRNDDENDAWEYPIPGIAVPQMKW